MTPTVSKSRTKGCFQCSKRRINCDLGQPQCRKCLQKGLECSGLGRIRFVPGVASRGKLKNSRTPALPTPEKESPEGCRDIAGHPQLTNGRETPSVLSRRLRDKTHQAVPTQEILPSSDSSFHIDFSTVVAHPLEVIEEDLPPHQLSLQPWLPPVGHHARRLLLHFSTAVAPVMVVIDCLKNGYREFILPLACYDDLLQRTVGVVAAQHLSQSQPQLRCAAEKGHAAIVERLQRDAACGTSVFSSSTWVTLIVLLVGETVNPSPCFGPLLRVLLLTAQNCDPQSMPRNLFDFLSKQTHMFEIIARPQLNEREGIEIISESLYNRLDWIPHDLPPESEHNLAVQVSREAFIETFQLYLRRASGISANHPSSVRRLRSLVLRLDPSADGAHALVWPCFVGCIESDEAADRQFFLERLTQIFGRTGFANVQAAIESLPRIWNQMGAQSWTSSLADILPILIM